MDFELEQYGDWDLADKILGKLPSNIKKRIRAATKKSAILLRDEIKRGIVSQAPGGKKFKPLHYFTISSKGSSKALIDKGVLLRSIDFKLSSDRFSAFVGISSQKKYPDGKSVAFVATIMEKGAIVNVTQKMRRYLAVNGVFIKSTTKYIIIPARPFIAPIVKAFSKNIEKIYEKEVEGLFNG